MKIHIGTSGFFYQHWNNVFYIEEISPTERLKYYSTFFSTVEINSTFYQLPKKETVINWSKKVPKNFIFSIKASRFITHQKRLLDYKEATKHFFQRIDPLKEKLGPILFQLPPSFQRDDERLITFITHLPKKHRYVFEFRHSTWENEEIHKLLEKYNISLCISDLNGHLTPLVATNQLVYIRLHGPQKAYRDSYSAAAIKTWEKRISAWVDEGREVFCYFDNDEKGYAIKDALRLQKLLNP